MKRSAIAFARGARTGVRIKRTGRASSDVDLPRPFFTDRLVQQRQAGPHTVAAYRDNHATAD
jgi:hypothetical protein